MKILIVGPAWIGDMVMAQSLFIILKRRHPGCYIHVLAPAWTQPLLDAMPEVDRAVDMPVGHGKLGLGTRLGVGKALREESYARAIVLPNSFKSALIPLFARIPVRTGWRGEARGWLLNDCRMLDKARYPLMVQRFAALASSPDEALPSPLPWPALAPDPEEARQVSLKLALEENRPVLALCPGAEYGESKRWPAAYFAEVAQRMIAAGWDIWILGSGNDKKSAAAVTSALPAGARGRCRDLTGETRLKEAIGLLSRVSAVASNDSGLMHVAAALARPLVVMYGSSSPDFTPPLAPGDKVRMLSLGLECSPCFKRECPLHHHRCMRDLKPSRVVRALEELTGASCRVEAE